MTKSQLRASVLDSEKQLSTQTKTQSDQAIFRHVVALPEYQRASTVFCYVGTPHEINTAPILHHAWEQGKRVAVPLCISKGIMEAREIRSMEDLQDGKYDIKEPKSHCPLIPPEELELVIVPCVTCNQSCYRLGYGGGFYDRYLAGGAFATAALCRGVLMRDHIPTEPHDLPVDLVVSDGGVYRREQ